MMQALEKSHKQTNKIIEKQMDFVTDTCEVHLLATVFSLTLLAAMQSYGNRNVFTVSTLTGLVWYNNMVAVSLRWNTDKTSLKTDENALLN